MTDSTSLNRRRLLQGAGAAWLLSISRVGMAASGHVVAMRLWPSSTYSRLTIESNTPLKYKQFALSNPDRVVVDIDNIRLNSALNSVGNLVRQDDPYI